MSSEEIAERAWRQNAAPAISLEPERRLSPFRYGPEKTRTRLTVKLVHADTGDGGASCRSRGCDGMDWLDYQWA